MLISCVSSLTKKRREHGRKGEGERKIDRKKERKKEDGYWSLNEIMHEADIGCFSS